MRLLRSLRQLQEAHGYLPEPALWELARRENVPRHRLQELVSYYPHFRTTPPPRVGVAVCRDLSCWLAGSAGRCARLRQDLAGVPGVEIREVSCLGRCDRAPAAAVNDILVSLPDVAPGTAWVERPELLSGPPPVAGRAWRSDPYPDPAGHYGVLRDLLRQERDVAAAGVLAAVKESGLRGRGGAGFPTGIKWEAVRREPGATKYVIGNADESEPGTFKDRVILAELPHLVIEGMLLAGLVAGAEQGILFLRHEYGPERRRFEEALGEARRSHLLGPDVLGSGFRFDLNIFVSPGGYVLGEETALLETLEDRRGQPRNRPPFPTAHGLHGRPTLINNVETLALVPAVVRRGPGWWKAQGKEGFAGLKFVALSGHVERPGVYEIPVGTTVRELIALGGGVKGGRPLKAFSPGGASAPFLPAAYVDVPLDFEAVARAGSMLGSGGVVVVAEGTDMLALAANVVRFFRNESCGECVPCRVGTQKAVEILERARAGTGHRHELDVLPDLGEMLRLTSLCGLGQTALNPILSVMQHWPEEVRGRGQGTP